MKSSFKLAQGFRYRLLPLLGLLFVSTGSVQAGTFVFDNYDVAGADVVAPTISFTDGGVSLDVSAGASSRNLWFANSFATDGGYFKTADVFQDLKPIHGGLGVDNWGGGTDNFEGTVRYNDKYWDEVLFFDFDQTITLLNFGFNDNHKDEVTGNYKYSLYTSNDGVHYDSVFLASSLTTTEYLDLLPGGLTGQYFALAAAGPENSKSYVESLTYNADPVPEPATLLLFGTGLAGLASLRRKKRS